MRSSPALIYMYQWVDRWTCLASRICPKRNHFRGQSSSRPLFGHAGCRSIAKYAVSVHAGTSQVDFEVDCPPPARSTRRSFDHHGKGNGNFVSERVSKNEKKVVSLIDLKEMKTRNDCEIACDCVKRANVVLHVDLCKDIFARKHTAIHKPTSAQPVHMCHDDTHTPNKIANR